VIDVAPRKEPPPIVALEGSVNLPLLNRLTNLLILKVSCQIGVVACRSIGRRYELRGAA